MHLLSGEGTCPKRRCINPTRSPPTQTEAGKLVALPAEVWRHILLNLWSNEEDKESILSCRLVSHSFKDLVDSLPPKLYWNPWLKFSESHPDRFLDKSPATNLTCDEEVSKFLQSLPLPDSAADGENPFKIHQTVRLFKFFGYFHEKKEDLKTILNKYGSFIKKLIFGPTTFAPKSLSNLSQILPTMENLQTLIISVCCTSNEWKQDSRNHYPTNLKRFSELVIANCLLTRVNDNSMFLNLFDTYGPQIKHLTLSSGDIHTNPSNFLSKFPNLEDLKVEELLVNKIYLEEPLIGNSWPKLRRLALGFRDCDVGSIGFRNVVHHITLFSSTLELLSFDLGRSAAKESDSDEVNEDDENDEVQFITPFPQLRKLILPFCFVRGSRQTIEERFNFDLRQLKVLMLQDFEEDFQNEVISKTELRRICEPFWRLVPPAVETICLRTEIWEEHLGMRVPIVYKCSRTTA